MENLRYSSGPAQLSQGTYHTCAPLDVMLCLRLHTDQERVRGEKFHAIGIEGAFLGYEENRVGYRVWHPPGKEKLFCSNQCLLR
jgi:hypothetical protein